MTLFRVLFVSGVAALAAGLLLIFVFDGASGWFAYAPLADGENLAITGGTIVSDQEKWGAALVAIAAMIGSGLLGYRLDGRGAIAP